MALLGKDQILEADDRKHQDIDIPEWGGTVRLMGLSGTERDAYEGSLVVLGSNGKVARHNLTDARAKLVAKCLVDDDGRRLFTDSEVKALGAKNGAVIDRLYDTAKALSGIGKEHVEAKAGNSGTGPSAGSTSA